MDKKTPLINHPLNNSINITKKKSVIMDMKDKKKTREGQHGNQNLKVKILTAIYGAMMPKDNGNLHSQNYHTNLNTKQIVFSVIF